MLTLAAAVYAFILATWILYVAIMNLVRVREMLRFRDDPALFIAFIGPTLVVGYALNFLLAWVVATAVFLDLPRPREIGLTKRLHRYVDELPPEHWRHRLAHWICSRVLDRFDPTGDHC